MGCGKPLSDEEKGKIKAYIDSGLSHRKIANKIGRSQNVISNFLRNEAEYGKNMKGGTYKATTSADRRAIIRAASNSTDSAAKIKQKTGTKASVATVRRIIRNTNHLKRMKIKKNLPLPLIVKQDGFSLPVNTCRINQSGNMWFFPMKRNLIWKVLTDIIITSMICEKRNVI